MLSIVASGVNEAFVVACRLMRQVGQIEDSRNGKVMVSPWPVSTTYADPRQRMLFNPRRDANPFFHVIEAMWMLAGRNDVETVARYASNMRNYSDDGFTINGAYGYRWRQHFDNDQLVSVIRMLRNDPTTRRAVLTMWDANRDLEGNTADSKDLPCNTHIYFRVRNGALDMTVCNRSNDIIWGCYGANVVHMSFLHEFVAQAAGFELGQYLQFSNNWHVYEQYFPLVQDEGLTEGDTPYNYPEQWNHVPLIGKGSHYADFLADLAAFFSEFTTLEYTSPFVRDVMLPVKHSWTFYKSGKIEDAVGTASLIKDTAVRAACVQWLERHTK